MFQLSIIRDTIPIHPSKFGLPPERALIDELNKKYANRVLHDVGLCICVFDIREASEGKVRYGDGFLWYTVIFRLTVFRPFPSELILAKVKSSDEEGIQLTIGFFDDIWIPRIFLPQPSAFDPNERAHFWLPNAEPTATTHELLDSPVAERMYIDAGPPKAAEGVRIAIESRRAPYTITVRPHFPHRLLRKHERYQCSMIEQGLGPTIWWQESLTIPMEEG